MRPFRNGKGSYDLIVPKFQKFAESRHQDKLLCKRDLYQTQPGFCIRGCPASGRSGLQTDLRRAGCCSDRKRPTHCGRKIFRQICEEYDRLAEEMIKRHKEGRGFNFFHFMIDLTRRSMRVQSASPDAAPEQSTWLSHRGVIFIRVISSSGNEQFLMGNVEEGIKTPTDPGLSLKTAMSMQKKSAETVLQNSTAAADVRRTPGISTEIHQRCI